MRHRWKFALPAVTGVLVALASSCGDRTARSSPSSQIEVIPEEAVQVVGTSEMITRIADLVVAPDGSIWILNTAEPHFLSMAEDGSVRHTWGRRGDGPNELRNPNAFIKDTDSGYIWVYDRGHHSLLRTSGPAGFIESISIPRESIPPGRIASVENAGIGNDVRAWIRPLDSAFLVAVARAAESPFSRMWHSELVLLQRDGSTEIVLSIADRVGDPAMHYGSQATQFMPFPLWDICPDGSFALYDPITNRIRRIQTDNAAEDTLTLPPERKLEITMARIFRMAFGFMREQAPSGQRPDSAAMYAELERQWGEMQAQSATVFPEYNDLQCAAQNTIWLQRFDPDRGMMGRSPEWYRIESDGSIREVHFPDAFRALRFEVTRVLGVYRGEFDVESAAWVQLPAQ